jgi:hypothetical protein
MELWGCFYGVKQPAALTKAFTRRQEARRHGRGKFGWVAGDAGRSATSATLSDSLEIVRQEWQETQKQKVRI